MNSILYFTFIAFCLCYGMSPTVQTVQDDSSTNNLQANYTVESVQANNCSTEFMQDNSSTDGVQANYSTEYVQVNNSSARCNSSTDNTHASYSSENVQASWSPCKCENHFISSYFNLNKL